MPGSKRFLQKGYRESLLCEECEQHIGRYEKYFKEAWYDEGKLPERVAEKIHWVRGLDYKRFRLFHLSVVWRAGVSRNSIFRRVRLGTHAERMRTMLLMDEPGEIDQYQFVTQVLVD
jgi:hypothetical protein